MARKKEVRGGLVETREEKAASELLKHDIGILSAPTAFGKTVIAAYLRAKRRVNTLVLVHGRLFIDQWYERLRMFLIMKCIGRIGGGGDESTGYIDVVMIQSIHRKRVVRGILWPNSEV